MAYSIDFRKRAIEYMDAGHTGKNFTKRSKYIRRLLRDGANCSMKQVRLSRNTMKRAPER